MLKDVAARILYNSKVSENYFRIGLGTGWSAFQAGQFVMVRVPDNVTFIRRPFSISQQIEGGIELLYKKVGLGTGKISSLQEGDNLWVMGPLGKGFSTSKREAIIVAGGFGIAPFIEMVKVLAAQGRKATLFYGGREMEDILLLDEFKAGGVTCHISTEDGSLGHKGYITELLSKHIDKPLKNSTIYCCGPRGLTHAVIKLANKHDIPAEVSLETYMGCGIGVCLGCIVKTKAGYKRACKDGPVFNVDELVPAP